jgi:hypothetical protein
MLITSSYKSSASAFSRDGGEFLHPTHFMSLALVLPCVRAHNLQRMSAAAGKWGNKLQQTGV